MAEDKLHSLEFASLFQERTATQKEQCPPLALLILNQPLLPMEEFLTLWHNSVYRACADGGSNRLYDALGSDQERQKFKPDLIKGDLDSIRPEVQNYYQSLGTTIMKDTDQDTTDMTKCLEEIFKIGRCVDVAILGAAGGRFDQTLQSINTAMRFSNENRRMFLIDRNSTSFVLQPGMYSFKVNKLMDGPTCGILPIGRPAHVLTKGLVWDLDAKTETSFGGLVSTSNAFTETDAVRLHAIDNPVVWTVERKLSVQA